MKKLKLIFALYLLTMSFNAIGQIHDRITIRGSVKEKNTQEPIVGVQIEITGGEFTQTNVLGEFRVKARIGDELVVRDESFNTVRYEIVDDQDIDILIVENPKEIEKQREDDDFHEEKIKLAQENLEIDAGISIDHVAEALEIIRENDAKKEEKRGTLYELLGDIYMYWKQPDLAESNYVKSLENIDDLRVKIKLGKSLISEKKVEEGLDQLREIITKKIRLTPIEKVDINEGLGDGYQEIEEYEKATNYYKIALRISQDERLDSRVIELNSKLAESFQKQGQILNAIGYFDNSIRLANRLDIRSSARQKTRAADFYSRNNLYEKEIELREEILEEIRGVSSIKDSLNEDDRGISPRVQNYKIATATAALDKFDEAIPYLRKSIKGAEFNNDLVVQKDATRKLGELYREKGELKKASEAFEEYEVIVDKLYIQKEQEISQATRFIRELNTKQNRIATLEKDRELNENKYKLNFASQEIAEQRSLRQLVIIYALIGVTVLLLLVAYLMSRNIKQQRYANNLLALKSLRSQMNPHFIFNALNSVNTFIAMSDEITANRYLTDFSLLMRAVLENSEEDFIPLKKEIELLDLYVKLEHFRFQDKFDYTITIDPEVDVKQYKIPPMLLQPYVENAVWHGLRYKEEKGKLTIDFRKASENALEILIIDNGIGRKKSKQFKTTNQKKRKSKGMNNIKKRIEILNNMYSDKVDIFITDLLETEEGTRVQLILKKDI